MSFTRVVREEIRASFRSPLGLVGAGIALALVCLAALGFGGRSEEFFFPLFAWGPLFLLPLTAAHLAQARGSRFLQGVFTTPVSMTEYLAARIVAALVIGAIYITALLPFVGVYAFHLGFTLELASWVGLGLGTVIFAVAVGSLIGVLHTSRGSVGAIATAGVLLVACLLFAILLPGALVIADEGTRAMVVRLLHISPGVTLMDALDLVPTARSSAPFLSFAAYGTATVGALTIAYVAFRRAQSPEGWEAGPLARASILLLAIALLLAPAAIASPSYERILSDVGDHSSSFNGIGVRLAPRGGLPDPSLPWFAPDVIEAGRVGEYDVLIFLVLATGTSERVHDVEVVFAGADLDMTPVHVTIEDPGPLAEDETGAPGGQRARYLRIPVTLAPTPGKNLAETHHVLTVNVTYSLGSGPDSVKVGAVVSVVSSYQNARLELGLAGAPAPLACFGGAAWRRMRTR